LADSSEAPNTLTRDEVIAELTGPGQSHELEPVLVGAATVRSFKNAPKSLRQLFADTRGDATFLVYENERWTFDEAWRDAARIATLLARDYGVVKGDRVAISMRNFPEWVLAFTAVTSLGAIAVAMNALWRPEELEYGLEDSGAKVLFADQERLERLADCSPDLKVQVIAVRPSGHDERELWGLLEGIGEVDMPAVDIQPDDPATIFYTSGSTGRPKGVVSSQRNIIAALFSWELDGLVAARMMGIEPVAPASQVATLLAVPLFHVTGSHAVYLSSYRAQRKMVCMYKWDAEAAAARIEFQ
jgi:long-chain acyl-CoA synthetase